MSKRAQKKLKPTMKSHYSHEIRKDVNLSELNSLKLEKTWPFIREEIVKEIGDDSELICVPFIEEASFYTIASCFVAVDDDENSFRHVGKLDDVVDAGKSDKEYLEWMEDKKCFVDGDFKFPHESVKITLQDEQVKNKVRVIMVNFYRHRFPNDKCPVNKIYLSKEKELEDAKHVYMITSAVMAKTVEFRATTGISSRIFHLGNPTTLIFKLEKFEIDSDGRLISRTCTKVNEEKNEWNKIYKTNIEKVMLTT